VAELVYPPVIDVFDPLVLFCVVLGYAGPIKAIRHNSIIRIPVK